ncbi:MAG: 2-C-methyl-D-erythritol 4-phosphate cytidylyltransferase [Roseburia sp.]|nr:2-C-methyl-D-erythritol 4-phosphate cytidylyltransferase [Roseburia sp.]
MNYAVILSGGVGSRMGLDMPKQYYKVADKPVIGYVLETIEEHDKIDGYIVVAAKEWQPFVVKMIEKSEKFLGFAMPGENRQLSIYSGLMRLKNVAKAEDLVLVQDAARANTSYDLIKRCLEITDDEDGAMPVLPMKDTVYLSRDGQKVDELLKREQIFAGQAPESFRYGKYVKANEVLLPDVILSINGSTEPAVKAGMQIALIDGEESNFKITTLEDLKRFERIVSEQ